MKVESESGQCWLEDEEAESKRLERLIHLQGEKDGAMMTFDDLIDESEVDGVGDGSGEQQQWLKNSPASLGRLWRTHRCWELVGVTNRLGVGSVALGVRFDSLRVGFGVRGVDKLAMDEDGVDPN